MSNTLASARGFTLLELVVVIMIVGILAAVGMRKMTSQTEVSKAQGTLAEMDQIITRIAGDAELFTSGCRTDFGYIGSNGALPPSGTGTIGTQLGTSELDTDEWGNPYVWDAGTLTLTSTGNGTPVSKRLYARSDLTAADYEQNVVEGLVMDSDGCFSLPGPDNVGISITYQSGGKDTTVAGLSGQFQFNNVPIGNHVVRAYYKTAVIHKRVSVVPECKNFPVEVVFITF